MRGWQVTNSFDARLMWAGLSAVGIYVIGDLFSGLLYDGYSFRDQAISELSAFRSPVRPLMLTIILAHCVLLIGFGIGIFRVANHTSLRWVGGLIIAIGLVGFPTHTIWAMTSRGFEPGFNDTMHISMTLLFSILVATAMVVSAMTYRSWFGVVTLLMLLLLIGFGLGASLAMNGIEENDTRWAGAFERANAYVYFAWIVMLAARVMRRDRQSNYLTSV